ncbi:hypothetical protein B0A61_06355 [Flavobacterium aquatile LMG 4008 = ATCC 11947]|uniref:Uncharacterized protein n=1 Tax=Flavobacterium aquatile LMG 4008 = ATCC 11947 TaxID=1453498 RepID=A0A095SQQ5_9FLAO|nr:hypothetical protein LG45_16385 [Flavobacterium aquatile LMG 4008 = ATCC 11947]OXA68086.1 hypothetical protein B0A61_06355 [Flavobacterium aquatile LMG 4008 = ATCC 11947]GEC80165.1 hypothetical protein FAQ01_30350 [Flavobacterium aquatile]
MKRIYKIIVVLLLVVNNLNSQNKNSFSKEEKLHFEPQINLLLDAFKTKKVAKLNKTLAIGYTIKGLPKGIEALALPQIIQQMPSFNKYEVKSLKFEKENYRIFLVFILKEQKINSDLLIDRQGKIKELNLLENLKMDVK